MARDHLESPEIPDLPQIKRGEALEGGAISTPSGVLDRDSVTLVNAIKNDKEGKSTSIRMTAIEAGDEEGFRRWMDKYMTIFTDPNDMEDEETIRSNWENGLALLYMVEGEAHRADGNITKEIGIRLAAVNPRVSDAAYVPYGGIDEPYRGTRCYTRAMAHNEEALNAKGINLIMNDCEDETRLAGFRDAYEGRSDEEITKICQDRLRFFMNNGYVFVDTDSEVQYCRPSSENPQNIQAYDRLGFKIIGHPEAYDQYFVKDAEGNRIAITKEGYKKMYLSLHTLDQYTDLDEKGLRTKFPAIEKFLNDLEKAEKDTFPLYAGPKQPPIHAEVIEKAAGQTSRSMSAILTQESKA